ncbi:protein of unknown function [Hyphomicrobium sp. MC1]|nr:protein of unknown function [Hyphomicrobium sp. MC1]
MYDLMTDVDGGAEFGQSLFYNLNCAINAGTEAARRSEKDLEGRLFHGRIALVKAGHGRKTSSIFVRHA